MLIRLAGGTEEDNFNLFYFVSPNKSRKNPKIMFEIQEMQKEVAAALKEGGEM